MVKGFFPKGTARRGGGPGEMFWKHKNIESA